MTSLVIVHNLYRQITVKATERVYDHENGVMTDDWKVVGITTVKPGELFQTFCTDTRKLEISEE